MPCSVDRRLRPWIAALNDVNARLDAAEALGINLSRFVVTCHTCNEVWSMPADRLRAHIKWHLALEREAA